MVRLPANLGTDFLVGNMVFVCDAYVMAIPAKARVPRLKKFNFFLPRIQSYLRIPRLSLEWVKIKPCVLHRLSDIPPLYSFSPEMPIMRMTGH